MRTSFRSLTLMYTLVLTCGVSFAVGGAMYWISSQSLHRAYVSRVEAASREMAFQLVDPVYRLEAFAVRSLLDALSESDPSLTRALVIDHQGRPFGGWSAWQQGELTSILAEARSSASWQIDTAGDRWLFVGPVMDASEQVHGLAVFEYSTEPLRQDLSRTASAALATALLVTLAGCVAGFFLARQATEPLSRLVESVREIGEQRFRTPPVQVSAFDEVRELAEAIHQMASQLDRTTVSLEEAQAARREAEQANRLKNRFLANLSHEVRTPLHAIVGNAELLFAEGVEPAQRDRVEGIQIAATSLLRQIEDVLDLSRIESGNLVLTEEPLDLVRLVHEVIEITQVRANPGTLDLFGLVAPEVERGRRGDPERIKQVLINLVSNALKFTERGEVVLEAVHGKVEDSVRFVIRDTGRGIPEAEMENIFQPFARLLSDRAVSGSGLGLAICEQLAQAMGAGLWLESVEGQGTHAIFEVPLKREDGARLRMTEPSPSPASSKILEGLQVLVVEDNLVNQLVVEAMLRRLGCEVRTARNGQEGVESWRRHRPSLILMDCSMPVLDGYEATRRIRHEEEQGGGEKVPIIALTAHALREDRRRCAEVGMSSFLTKPLTLEELQATLSAFESRV